MVTGSITLLHFAQGRFLSLGRILTRVARGAFAAYMLQVPMLIGLSVALRPLPIPVLAKAWTVGVLGVAGCLGLGAILTARHHRLR